MTTRVVDRVAKPAKRDLKRHIAGLIFASHGYSEIVTRAARIVGGPIALLDDDGALLASSGFTDTQVATLCASFDDVRNAGLRSREPQVVSLDTIGGIVAVAVHGDDAPIGLLLVGISPSLEHGEALEVAEQLANVVLFEFLRQRTVHRTEERLGSSFLHELLDDASLSPSTLQRVSNRARLLGYDLASAYWVVVLESASMSGEPAHRETLRTVVGRVARTFNGALSVERDHGVVLLLPESTLGRSAAPKLHTVLTRVILDTANGSAPPLVAGLSEHSVTIGQLAAEVERLRRTVELRRTLQLPEVVVLQQMLGPYRLLMAISAKEELLEYWSDTIRELYQYDTLNRSSLIRTLVMFFECCSNVIEASRRLFIHRNTMNRRLQRIEDILNANLGDPETLFRLQLALRVHELVLAQGLLR